MNPFTHLRAQVKANLEREAKLSPAERRQHQWQFFTTVGEVTYIVGKGGANTMFYMVGQNGERHMCSPKDMLDIISSWGQSRFAVYAVCKKPSKFSHGPFQSEEEALAVKDAPKGSYIVGITPENKVIRLHKLKSGLMDDKWVPFKPKKKG
tara:strand:- start:112373 stop:112825 length:453 start_codon:yes stop_codon:yes gene_type:complete